MHHPSAERTVAGSCLNCMQRLEKVRQGVATLTLSSHSCTRRVAWCRLERTKSCVGGAALKVFSLLELFPLGVKESLVS